MKAMKLAAFGTPLTPTDLTEPPVRSNTVRIRTAYAAVNNIDRLLMAGGLPEPPPLPLVPGLELSGVIDAVGPGVTGWHVGQPVAFMGGLETAAYADFVIADPQTLIVVPDGLDLKTAAAVVVNYVTAASLLSLVPAQPGEVALVYGAAGGVGTALVQLAHRAGLKVLGLVGNLDKTDYVLAQGAHAVIDRKSADLAEHIQHHAEGRGVDVSFNIAGGATFAQDAGYLAPFGQIVGYGFEAGMPAPETISALTAGFSNSLSLRLFDLFTLYRHRPEVFVDRARSLLSRVHAGELAPQIDRIFDLADAHAAHDALAAGVQGKLLLRVN